MFDCYWWCSFYAKMCGLDLLSMEFVSWTKELFCVTVDLQFHGILWTNNGLHFPVPTPSWFQVSTPSPKSDQIMTVSMVHQFTNWFWIASCSQLDVSHGWRELEIESGSLDPLAVKHGNSPPCVDAFPVLDVCFLLCHVWLPDGKIVFNPDRPRRGQFWWQEKRETMEFLRCPIFSTNQ